MKAATDAASPGELSAMKDILDEARVLTKQAYPSACHSQAASSMARLGRVDLYLGLRNGRRRYDALLRYISETCICPLCPWTAFLRPHGSPRHMGGFPTLVDERDDPSAFLAMRHASIGNQLPLQHLSIVTHLLTGG